MLTIYFNFSETNLSVENTRPVDNTLLYGITYYGVMILIRTTKLSKGVFNLDVNTFTNPWFRPVVNGPPRKRPKRAEIRKPRNGNKMINEYIRFNVLSFSL